jgi:hypothetical protein
MAARAGNCARASGSTVATLNASPPDAQARPRLRRRARGRGRCGGAAGDDDAVAVLLHGRQADALHRSQLLEAAEGTVGLAIGDDRLGLRGTDIEQHAVEGGGVGGVDVHALERAPAWA